MSAFKKLVPTFHGEQKADLYMPCDGLVLQQSLLSLQLWEEKLHSGDLINVIWIFFPLLLCDLFQGPLMSAVLLFIAITAGFLQAWSKTGTEKQDVSECVCVSFITRALPCWILPRSVTSTVWSYCSLQTVLGWNVWGLSPSVVQLVALLNVAVKAQGHDSWISLVILLCCRASGSLVTLVSGWPLVWTMCAPCWLAHLLSQLHTQALEGFLSNPLLPLEDGAVSLSPPASYLTWFLSRVNWRWSTSWSMKLPPPSQIRKLINTVKKSLHCYMRAQGQAGSSNSYCF